MTSIATPVDSTYGFLWYITLEQYKHLVHAWSAESVWYRLASGIGSLHNFLREDFSHG